MRYGRLNIIIGSIVIVLGGIGGFILGGTLEKVVTDGSYAIPFARIFSRGGHTHGLLFAFYNLIIGLLVDRLRFSDGMKRATSLLAAFALLMSIGLLLRGLDGGGITFAPVGLLGGLLFIVSAVFVLVGAIKGIDT
jgi:hypothetical protein